MEEEIILRRIDERINTINQKTTKEELEMIDNNLIYIMNLVIKAVEGLTRKVPFSMAKLKGQVLLGF